MTDGPPQAPNGPWPADGVDERLDPANQQLADALRRSFGVLKLVMIVLVVLYLFSGVFTVDSNEVGLVMRFGRILGATPGAPASDAVLGPGLRMSLPYPFDRWVTVPTSERELPVSFMYELSDEERATGIAGYKFNDLSPMRDDYLITGDINILHASLIIKYKITDPIAYVTNLYPMPDKDATLRSREFLRYPEYSILSHLARDAVIEAAAGHNALEIRGSRQDAFLVAVARRIDGKLDELEAAGRSLGITVDPNNGVLAPKSGGTVEAIMPPRQVQQVFDEVFAAQSAKSSEITRAKAEARERLLQTAGDSYVPVAEAVQDEYVALLELAEATRVDADAEVPALRERLEELGSEIETLLRQASGEVQAIVASAEIRRDQMIKEVAGDYDQFLRLRPEYLRRPEIFMSRLRDETFSRALDSSRINKFWVPTRPEGGPRIWLKIPRPRASNLDEASDEGKKSSERELGKAPGVTGPVRPIMPR